MKFWLEVEVEHREGSFKSRDEIEAELIELLAAEDLDVDGTRYEVVSVSPAVLAPPRRRPRGEPRP